MTNKWLALFVLAAALICAAILAVAIALQPVETFRAIDNAPIKVILLAAGIVLIAFVAAVVYGVLHVPTPRKFCVVMGFTTVGPAVTCALGYGIASFQSGQVSYVASQNGGLSANLTITCDGATAASYSFNMLFLAIGGGIFFVLANIFADFCEKRLAGRSGT